APGDSELMVRLQTEPTKKPETLRLKLLHPKQRQPNQLLPFATVVDAMTVIFSLGVLVQVGMMWSEASARVDKVDVVAALQDPVQLNGAYAIAVAGDYAYITAASDAAISVLNIADPTSPTLAGSIKDLTILDISKGIVIRGDYGVGIAGLDQVVLDGNYAYVAAGRGNSLLVFDITDPTNLTVASVVHDPTILQSANGIDIVGDLAYVATNDRMAVFNISDPSSPSPVGNFDAGGQMDGAFRVAVVGNHAYVTASARRALVVLDVTDLSNITVHSVLSNFTELNQPMGLEIVGNYAYVSTLHGVVTVDIIEYFRTWDGHNLVGNHALVACDTDSMHGGMAVIDISTPSNLNEVSFFGEHPHSVLEYASGVKVDGDYAFVVGGEEGYLTVIDVSNPHNPSIVSSIFDSKLEFAEGLAIAGDYAYVAASEYEGLVAVHIADKANLTIAGFLQDDDLFGYCIDVAIAGNYAFVTAYSEDAVTAVDISNPNNLTVASHFQDGDLDGAENIVIVGNFAYVTAYREESLTILNITDPYNMNIAGTIRDDRLDGARGLAVVGDYAYVACSREDGFAAIHVADPSNLTIVGYVEDSTLLEWSYAVAVDGNHAFVTSRGHHSVTMIDISDPSNLSIVGNWQHPALLDPFGIAIAGAYAYVTGYDSFLVFSIDTTTTTTVLTNTMTTVTVTTTAASTVTATTGVTAYISHALHWKASAFASFVLFALQC
ncbi:unnamed protein product, partial [Symbiodinium sp. CCMP2456]